MKTLVGVKRIAFLMPESSSLKEKRQIIRRLRSVLSERFNLSFAEIDTEYKWQRSIIAVTIVSNTEGIIKSSFLEISNLIESTVGVRVFNDVDDIFCYEDESESAWVPFQGS